MKSRRMLTLVATSLALLAGCASVSRPLPIAVGDCWTEQAQLGERTRFYPKLEERQLLRAAERLLRLSGQDDVRIESSAHSLSAEFHRERWFYLFLVAHQASVWDHWVVATRPQADGVQVCVQVRGQYFSDTFVLGAEPVSNSVYPANARERNPGTFFKPPASAYPVDFDTFWSRLDYVLGLNPAWVSCPAGSSGGLHPHPLRQRLEFNPLCHGLVDDPAAPPREP